MRKLMWFTIGFGLACGVCAYGMMCAWLPPVSLGIVAAALGGICVFRRKPLLRIAIAVLAGCAVGICWFAGYQQLYLKPVTSLDGQKLPVCITADDFGDETSYGIGVDGRITIEGKDYQVRSYIQDDMTVQPSDRIEGMFRPRTIRAKEFFSWLTSRGMFN